MIDVMYFAWVRERIGLPRERLDTSAATVADLVEELKRHFSQDAIVEIMAVVATFGYLNRWNDSMATGLEDEPTEFARQALAGTGWTPGKHAE